MDFEYRDVSIGDFEKQIRYRGVTNVLISYVNQEPLGSVVP